VHARGAPARLRTRSHAQGVAVCPVWPPGPVTAGSPLAGNTSFHLVLAEPGHR
jgi:hypothetical protein